MKTKKIKVRQGFTIVELVIVIGVIGVLTAVLVPTFINLNQKANQAADESLVKNLNTQLAIKKQSEGANKTMSEALSDALEAGYKVENLTPKGNKDIVWNQETDEFAQLEAVPTEDAYKYWTVAKKAADLTKGYSAYLYFQPEGDLSVNVGVDVGEYSDINITYAKGAVAKKDVRFRTRGGSLKINADTDTVSHWAELDDLTVEAVAGASYHEFGTVKGKAVISKGHLQVEKGAEVPQVEVKAATGSVKVTANESTIITADAASSSQTSVIANTSEVFVSGLSEDKITGNAIVAEPVSNEQSLINALNKGYARLDADLTFNSNLTITKTDVLDLNGHTLTINGLLLNNGNLTIDDSADNGLKKVSNVVNDATSAKTSADVSTESSLSYTKTLQGTLKADSIITSSNHNLTVLNGSFVSELDYHKYYETEYEVDGFIYVAKDAKAVIYNGAFFSENLEDATEQYAAAAVAVISNRGNTSIYKGEFVTKYCRETYDPYFNGNGNAHTSIAGLYNKDRMQYSYYSISSYGGSLTISPKTNSDVVVYAARGALSMTAGDAEIKGGTFNAYHFYAAYIAGSAGKVKGTITGGEFNLIDGGHLAGQYALDIGNDAAGDGGKRQPANVTILDCVVNSDKNAIKVANSTGSIVVYGGKYNKTISNNFIDEADYKIVQEGGYYVVKKK